MQRVSLNPFLGQNKKVLEIAAKESEASQRTETAAEMMGINNSPWNPDEQKLLEQVEIINTRLLNQVVYGISSGLENVSSLYSWAVGPDRRNGAQQVQEGLYEEIQGIGWIDQGEEGCNGCGQEVLADDLKVLAVS